MNACAAQIEEDIVEGLIRCPSCGAGILMANSCNVTTCYSTKHANGGYFYFCAHCKAECPDGEATCLNCPQRNDRFTRDRVRARRKEELRNNSSDNPFVVD